MPLQATTNTEISSLYRIGYEDTVHQAVQQTDERFAGMSMVASDWTDNQYVFEELGKQDWRTNNTRFGSTNPTEVSFGQRSGFKTKVEVERIMDKWDESLLRELGNLTSPVITAIQMGLKRKRDEIFIAALTADSKGGVFPHTTDYAFPAGNIIAVGEVPLGVNAGGTTALGLTPGKILSAKRKVMEADYDVSEEDLNLAMSPRQYQDLIEYSQVYKNDTWAAMIAAWANDTSKPLLGVKPIISNQLISNGSGVRRCVLFAKQAMVTSPFELKAYLSVREDLKYSLQIAQYGLWGAMRVRDELVYQILCDEDTAPTGTLATTY